jgi:hypothetical protein
MKKWIIPSLVVLVLAAGVVYMTKFPTQAPIEEEQKEAFDPSNPNFFLGQVVSVDSAQIEIKSGPNSYIVMVDSAVKLTKQVTINGAISLVDAVPADFIASATVVVYFPEKDSKGFDPNTPTGTVITPEKIQIISQP